MASNRLPILLLFCYNILIFRTTLSEECTGPITKTIVTISNTTTISESSTCKGNLATTSTTRTVICDKSHIFDLKYSISVNKTAVQSSDLGNNGKSYGAFLAVDGKRANQQTGDYSITENELFPWWRVDLGQKYDVQAVSILTRNEQGYEHRLHDFEVRVGDFDPIHNAKNTRISANFQCHYFPGHGLKNGQLYSMNCIPGAIGRYLSIQIISDCATCPTEQTFKWVILSEVDVYGCPEDRS